MHGDLMALEVLRLDKGGTGDDAGADGEERPLDSLLVEIRKQVGRVGRRAVIVRQTPVVLCRASRDIVVALAASARPPATSRVLGRLGVVRTAAKVGGSEVGDGDTGVLDLLDPLLDFVGIQRGRLVKRRIVLRTQRCPCAKD